MLGRTNLRLSFSLAEDTRLRIFILLITINVVFNLVSILHGNIHELGLLNGGAPFGQAISNLRTPTLLVLPFERTLHFPGML
tara:strand:- start:228 stop:473 length:246 start_codon:yes stop_codon:yes gene_type:complete